MKSISLSICLLFLVGCASISKEPEWSNTGASPAEILIYRDDDGLNENAPAFFGSSMNYVFEIKGKEYAHLTLPSGDNEFKVRGYADASSSLKVNLSPGVLTCLQIDVNHALWFAVPLPILFAVIPGYFVNEVTCPNEGHFSTHNRVNVKL